MWYVWVVVNGAYSIRSQQYTEFAALLVGDAILKGGGVDRVEIEFVDD